MFKLNQSESFSWPVEVMIAGNGGKFTKETFDVEFKRVDESRLQEIAMAVARDDMDDRDVVKEVVVGWGGITDNGEAVPFSPSNLDRVLEVPGVARAIARSFVAAHRGAAAKN